MTHIREEIGVPGKVDTLLAVNDEAQTVGFCAGKESISIMLGIGRFNGNRTEIERLADNHLLDMVKAVGTQDLGQAVGHNHPGPPIQYF